MYNASGQADNKEQLVRQYADLVRKIAYQIKAKLPANIEVDDLIQTGMIGLLDAAQKYKENPGAQFTTYASQRIHGAIMDELRSSDWLPRSVRKQMREIETAIQFLEQRSGRAPTESEVANKLGISLSNYHASLNDGAGHKLVYFEDFQKEEGSEHFLDQHVRSQEGDAIRLLMSSEFKENLKNAIDNLPEREKILMSLYYEQDLNLKEIGAVMNVTESRVSQLHSQAVARLRAKLKDDSWTGQV
jgi:RNA polymerase sigma factor for flagellar operon FliA